MHFYIVHWFHPNCRNSRCLHRIGTFVQCTQNCCTRTQMVSKLFCLHVRSVVHQKRSDNLVGDRTIYVLEYKHRRRIALCLPDICVNGIVIHQVHRSTKRSDFLLFLNLPEQCRHKLCYEQYNGRRCNGTQIRSMGVKCHHTVDQFHHQKQSFVKPNFIFSLKLVFEKQ